MSAWQAGPAAYGRALALLRDQPRLWRYLGVPLALNVLAGLGLYAGLLSLWWRLPGWVLPGALPGWAQPLLWLFYALGILLALVVTGLLIGKFGVILGAPWYGQLAETIERDRLGDAFPEPTRHGLAGALGEIGGAIGYELKKLVLTLGLGLPLLALQLVPVAGSLVATVGGLALAITVACMDYVEPAFSRRGLRFRTKLGLVMQHMPATGGFGAVAFVLTSVPVLNFFTVPLSVTAGLLLFCDRIAPALEATPARA